MKTITTVVVMAFFVSPFQVFAAPSSNQFQITSVAFDDNASIPQKFTCDGGDINPSLAFKNVPPKTKSLALTVTDPDAPEGTWAHWVIYNMSPNTDEIIENTNPGTEGLSDFGKYTYGGPCPSDDRLHHYVFQVYALNEILNINEGPSITEVQKAMQGHIIAQTQLIGTYQRSS